MYAFRLRDEQMKQVIYNDGRRINIKVIPTRPYYEEQSLCVFGGWGFDEERKKKKQKKQKKIIANDRMTADLVGENSERNIFRVARKTIFQLFRRMQESGEKNAC